MFRPSQVVLGLFFVLVGYAAEPNRWKGLLLDETTPEQAIQVLGMARKDGTDSIDKLVKQRLYGAGGGGFLLQQRKKDVVRMMRYEDLPEFSSAVLIFKEDKLVMISLTPNKGNKIAAREFPGLYEGVTWRTVYSEGDWHHQQYTVSQASGQLRPKNYPTIYWLLGLRERQSSGFVIGSVGNAGWGSVVSGALGSVGTETPGTIYALDLVSAAMLPPKPKNKSLE